MMLNLRIVAILLLAVAPARSSIVYIDLPPPEGFFGIGPGNPFTKSFDIDQNGTVDIEFVAGVDILGFYVKAPLSTRIVVVSGYGVLPMQAGEMIGPELGPTSHPRASLFPDTPIWTALTGLATLSFGFNDNGNIIGGPWHSEETGMGDDGYLGFEFAGEHGVHYGWIHIEEFAGVGGWFYEYAYDSRPGVPIRAGARAGEGLLALEKPRVVNSNLWLTISGQLGTEVVLERSPDLTSWTPILTNASPFQTVFHLNTNETRGFFRVVEQVREGGDP